MNIKMLAAEARRLADDHRYGDALFIWRDVCAWGPPNAQYRVEMAICLIELGAEEEAAFELETALALDSTLQARLERDVHFSGLLGRLG